MHKNEPIYLDTWLKYYGNLFGYNNLYVIDNGSTFPTVFDVLHIYARLGVNIIFGYNQKEHFLEKGQVVAELVSRLGDYDFLLPIDCDEYIFFMEDKPNFQEAIIQSYFESLRGMDGAFIIKRMFLNIPNDIGYFIGPKKVTKGFISRDQFLKIDTGFHNPRAKSGNIFDTKLAYLHFASKTFEESRRAAREKIGAFVDVNDREALIAYKGIGNHAKHVLLKNEEQFYKQNLRFGNVYFKGAVDLFKKIGADEDGFLKMSSEYIPVFDDEDRPVVRFSDSAGNYFYYNLRRRFLC